MMPGTELRQRRETGWSRYSIEPIGLSCAQTGLAVSAWSEVFAANLPHTDTFHHTLSLAEKRAGKREPPRAGCLDKDGVQGFVKDSQESRHGEKDLSPRVPRSCGLLPCGTPSCAALIQNRPRQASQGSLEACQDRVQRLHQMRQRSVQARCGGGSEARLRRLAATFLF